MKTAIRVSLIWVLVCGAFAGMAQTLTCTFQFIGTGTIGTRSFTNATVTVTTVGSTTSLQPNGQAGYSLVNDSASISISGIGSFQFTVPLFTFVSTPGNNAPGTGTTQVGFGNAQSGNLTSYAGVIIEWFSGFNGWDMHSSMGPIQLRGTILDWSQTIIKTNGGVVNLYDQDYQIPLTITFQATLTGTPPVPILARTGVLSHIAAGGGWNTTITLVNTLTTATSVTVAFHSDDGSALSLPVTTIQQGISQKITTSSVSATINPNAMLLISTGDQVASTVVGWADVLSTGSLGGYAIFRQLPQTGSPSEGTVPLQSLLPSTITLPYDNSAGFVMGVALANLSTSFASVTVTMWDDIGNQLGTQNLTIAGSGHTAFVLPNQFPLTAGKRGIVTFQATGGIAGLGLRFSPFGTFTSVPTM